MEDGGLEEALIAAFENGLGRSSATGASERSPGAASRREAADRFLW
jgi:hypothetical protein